MRLEEDMSFMDHDQGKDKDEGEGKDA